MGDAKSILHRVLHRAFFKVGLGVCDEGCWGVDYKWAILLQAVAWRYIMYLASPLASV